MAKCGSVTVITGSDQFKTQINEAKEAKKIVAIDFFATWCGPCRHISPVFEALAERYPGVVFLKVDVDTVQEVAQQYDVSAMPTFVFLKDGVEIDKLVGASKSGLEDKVAQHAAAV